jgi:hypothetical protein
MIRKIAVLTTFAALLVGAASAQAADVDSVTGGGSVIGAENPLTPFMFTLKASADGDGRLTFWNADLEFTGDVDCFVRDGDTVFVSGSVVESKTLEGGYYAISVTDAGNADLVSFTAGNEPLFCGAAGAPALPLVGGNVSVH